MFLDISVLFFLFNVISLLKFGVFRPQFSWNFYGYLLAL